MLQLTYAKQSNTRNLYFPTYADAARYARNAGLSQRPAKRRVWIAYAWRYEWSITVHKGEQHA